MLGNYKQMISYTLPQNGEKRNNVIKEKNSDETKKHVF